MGLQSSYQPFMIGQFKTGQFQYLKPWQSPQDAFDPFDNAYVYRGVVTKRSGYTKVGHTGLLRYCNNEIIKSGDGSGSYSGTISNKPIVEGTFEVTVQTSTTKETFTDDGLGVLTGSLGDSGTIDYTSGAWTLSFGGGRTVAANIPIVAEYTYTPGLEAASTATPIMGINYWHDDDNNTDLMVVCDQNRMCTYDSGTKLFDPICDFQQIIYVVTSGAATTTGSLTIGFTNLAPYSLQVTDGTNTISDIPTDSTNGTFSTSATLNNANTSIVDYTLGTVTISYAAYGAGVPITITITGKLQGDYFTGGNTNFFNYTNWRSADGTPSYLYMTNNIDRVTTFDGTYLSRIPYSTTLANFNAFTNDIATALDVMVYKNRLLFIRPTIVSSPSNIVESQVIRWSSVFLPRNFIANIVNNGGTLECPTGDWLQATSFLRDVIVCFFQNTTWLFRFTGNTTSPFRFDKLNDSRSCNAPYGSISYDLRSTAMGARGLIFCDGNNVERYDLSVIDVFQDIDHDWFIQCIAQRYDNLNQGWMIYPSQARLAGNHFSDKAIIYNYLEDSWSTYSFNLSCIGISSTFTDITWNDFAANSGSPVAGLTWEECDFPWNFYLSQALVPSLYGGSEEGYVYLLDIGNTDDGEHIDCNITSKQWNPFIEQGMRARFGYVDIYYTVNSDITLQIEFFINNDGDPVTTKFLTLDGPTVNSNYAWKRVYINLQGEFVQMKISTPILNPEVPTETVLNDGSFSILGIILWAQPAGRLVPGGFA